MCYDQKYIDDRRCHRDGTYIPMAFMPVRGDGAEQGRGRLREVHRQGPRSRVSACYAWAAGIELQQALQSVVKDKGNNGITRANLLDRARRA